LWNRKRLALNNDSVPESEPTSNTTIDMKKNRFTLIALLATAALATVGPLRLAAEDEGTDSEAEAKPNAPRVERAPRTQNRLAHLQAQLKLTDEQVVKLKPVLKEQGKKARALREDNALTRQERVSKLKEIRQEISAQIKPILTTDQYEKWQKMQERPAKKSSPE
jgi:hypothetical protein